MKRTLILALIIWCFRGSPCAADDAPATPERPTLKGIISIGNSGSCVGVDYLDGPLSTRAHDVYALGDKKGFFGLMVGNEVRLRRYGPGEVIPPVEHHYATWHGWCDIIGNRLWRTMNPYGPDVAIDELYGRVAPNKNAKEIAGQALVTITVYPEHRCKVFLRSIRLPGSNAECIVGDKISTDALPFWNYISPFLENLDGSELMSFPESVKAASLTWLSALMRRQHFGMKLLG